MLVNYRQEMLLQIPVAATNLIPSQTRAQIKLTAAAVRELVTLSLHYEVLCLSTPPPSGVDSRPNSKNKSKASLRSSSRR